MYDEALEGKIYNPEVFIIPYDREYITSNKIKCIKAIDYLNDKEISARISDYNRDGLIIRDEFGCKGDINKKRNTENFIYNNQNKCILSKDENDKLLHSYNYDDNGNVICETSYSYVEDEVFVIKITHEYEDNKRIKTSLYSNDVLRHHKFFTYDEKGRLKSRKYEAISKMYFKQVLRDEEFEYDENDRIINITCGRYATSLVYDDSGRLIINESINNDNVIDNKIAAYKYNDKGLLIGMIKNDVIVKYDYDDNDNLKSIHRYDKYLRDIGVNHYSYDKGLLTKIEYTSMTRMEYSYDFYD